MCRCGRARAVTAVPGHLDCSGDGTPATERPRPSPWHAPDVTESHDSDVRSVRQATRPSSVLGALVLAAIAGCSSSSSSDASTTTHEPGDYANRAERFLTSFEMEDQYRAASGQKVDFVVAECAPPKSIDVGTTFRCKVTDADSNDWIAVVKITGPSDVQVMKLDRDNG